MLLENSMEVLKLWIKWKNNLFCERTYDVNKQKKEYTAFGRFIRVTKILYLLEI